MRTAIEWRRNLAGYLACCDCGATELHLRLTEAEQWALTHQHEGETMTDHQPRSLKLGDLIEELERHDPTIVVPLGFGDPHSYRGFYDQVAFEPRSNVTVGDMLAAARSALGKTFTGYKGGEFTMRAYTDTWLANYGECGEQIGAFMLGAMLAGGR